MKPGFLTSEDLGRLQANKGDICISIIVPVHRLAPDRSTDPLQVRKAVDKAKEILVQKFGSQQAGDLLDSIDQLYAEIDFLHNAEGIALYVSRNVRQTVPLFFPVKQKILISDTFEVADWLYQLYYSKPYFVLLLSEAEARLFSGIYNELEEVNDVHFPMKQVEEYEYNRPSRGTSYVGHAFVKEYERDKSEVEEIRLSEFLHKLDDALVNYVANETPLVIAGAKKDLAYFMKLTRQRNLAGEISGNYFHLPAAELGTLCFDQLKLYLDRRKLEHIREFEEKHGQGSGVAGIQEAWKAAKEGRAGLLLVEKNYSRIGYLVKGNDLHLYLHPPVEVHEVVSDAAGTLVELVREKRGEVILVEDGLLKDHGHVALITRY